MSGEQTITVAMEIQPGEKIIRPDQQVYQFVPYKGWVYIGEGWDVFISDDNYAEGDNA